MMNLTKIALTKTQLVLMSLFLFCLGGLLSFFSMSRAENPLYTVRLAQIVTYWPGASPERMADLVTDKIEKKLQEISELEYIESESKTGVSVIRVKVWDHYKNMRPIWDDLRRKVEDSERELPLSAKKPIVNDEFGDIFGIVLALTWDGFDYARAKDIADDFRNELLEFEDVAKVDIYGAQEERVFIDYNIDKLKELSLTTKMLGDILKTTNIVQSGGTIEGPAKRIALEPTGNFESIEEIRQTLIEIPNSRQIVSLGDIASVYRDYIDPPNQLMHTDGEPSLGIAISMRDGGNILELGDKIERIQSRYLNTYPIGIDMVMLADQPQRVNLKIHEFVINLLQAVLIVSLVMFAFLGLRTGIIVASLIPAAILITFAFMFWLKIGLNQITLASLIIALGMLVDNAIVMSESILTEIKQGIKPYDAALNSAKELRVPLLISSLTTSAAFIPFFLAKSGTGEYVGALFIVVSVTLLSSWVISLTMIPIFCVHFLRPKQIPGKLKKFFLLKAEKLIRLFPKKIDKKNPFDSRFYKYYRKFLLLILKHRVITLICLLSTFTLSLCLFQLVPKTFFPPSNVPMFTAEIELPVDSSIFNTKKTIETLESFINEELLTTKTKEKDGITTYASFIGNGGPRYRLQHDPEPANAYYSFMLFNASSYHAISKLIPKLETYIFDHFPDVKATIKPLQEGTPVKHPITVRLTGQDSMTLLAMADKLKIKLGNLPGTKNIDDDWGQSGKKIVIKVDPLRSERANITNSDIAKSLESTITGVKLTDFREEDDLIPIILRSEVAKNLDLIGSSAFNVTSQTGGHAVPLRQVADIYFDWEPSIIFKRNRLDTVTVFADLEENTTATEIDKQVIAFLESEQQSWPFGYKWELGGENEEAGKAQRSIFAELPMAFLLILILLMAQFNSLKKTSIILMTIPMAFIGVVLGLLITKTYFGIMSILGVISLAGIVINNAIVLLDRIKLEIKENHRSPQDAIILSAQRRARPILLTTITTISSLLPLWFGGGDLWAPMTIAIIFGLSIATVLTLGIVPVLYSCLYRISYKNYDSETHF